MTESIRKIGLVVGLSCSAGIFYYEKIYANFKAENKPLSIVLNHADVDRVLDLVGSGDRIALGIYLASLANDLFAAGATFVSVAAVAPHIAIDQMKALSNGPIVSVLDCVADALNAKQVERVAIFGSRAAMESNLFGSIPDQRIVRLSPQEAEMVDATYDDIATNDKRGTKIETLRLSALAHDLVKRRGAQAIVLAGTDFSTFYSVDRPDFPSIDVGRLHLDRLCALCRNSTVTDFSSQSASLG